MKRIFYILIALFVTIVASAQERIVRVYEYDKNGNLNDKPSFTTNKKVKVVFFNEDVDLGLPSGTIWATCNVGANSPEEYGFYFAWGETNPKETYADYKFSNYKWGNGTIKHPGDNTPYNQYTKYCTNNKYGTVDNKTVLDPEDDAATVRWGDGWCIPTLEQIQELINPEYTTTKFTTYNDKNGIEITSKKNGKSIFLPLAGSCGYGDGRKYDGSTGYYWSRSLETDENDPDNAGYVYLRASDFLIDSDHSNNWGYSKRYAGFSVRPVRVQK